MEGNPVLKKSVDLMLSKDYKDRFKAEYMQLYDRFNGLCRMLHTWDTTGLTFTPDSPRELYTYQVEVMKKYLDILVIRAKIENIKL
jgi:hypothetical protein